MRWQIRTCVFETNSSSTHSVTILTDSEYKDYLSEKLLISTYGETIYKENLDKELAEQKAKAILKWKNPDSKSFRESYHDDLKDYLGDIEEQTMWEWKDDDRDIEHAVREINGEKVHALSIYSYDG